MSKISRARDYVDPRTGATIWFDTSNPVPTDQQIELLALVERTDLDDLLEESLSQRGIYDRLFASLRESMIPAEVLERRDRWRQSRHEQPACRICDKIGDSTKHHFVNKWVLRELSGYQNKWASRTRNCIPVCIDCHRDLHSRNNGSMSIVPYLREDERAFAERALSALAEERPGLLILIARGDDSVYESLLIKDWIAGAFRAPVKAVHGERAPA